MICISQDVYLKALCFILSLSLSFSLFLSLSLFLFLSLFLSVSSRVKIHARGNCVIVSRDVYSNALPFALSLSLSVSSHVKSEESGDSFAASKRRTVWAGIQKTRTISIHGAGALPSVRQGSAERFDIRAEFSQSLVAFREGNGGIYFCFLLLLLRDAGF